MGDLLRRYWIPALLSAELPEPDCPPVRVKLLSERLLAFRDTQGRVGLIDEFCAHRGVSLWFGRNEENGLRCPYHGWKYDVHRPMRRGAVRAGRRAASARRSSSTSYPCVELGDVIWAYMGPPELQAAVAGLRMGHGAAFAPRSSRSARRNATICRRWRAASTPPTSRSCTATTCSSDSLSCQQGRRADARNRRRASRWSRPTAAW